MGKAAVSRGAFPQTRNFTSHCPSPSRSINMATGYRMPGGNPAIVVYYLWAKKHVYMFLHVGTVLQYTIKIQTWLSRPRVNNIKKKRKAQSCDTGSCLIPSGKAINTKPGPEVKIEYTSLTSDYI